MLKGIIIYLLIGIIYQIIIRVIELITKGDLAKDCKTTIEFYGHIMNKELDQEATEVGTNFSANNPIGIALNVLVWPINVLVQIITIIIIILITLKG